MKYIITLLALLVAAPALATNDAWVTSPAGTQSCRLPQNRVCYYDATSTSTTPALDTSGCREITASFLSDITDNSLTANTAKAFRFFGAGLTALTGDDEAIWLEGVTLDGDSTTSTDAVYAFDAPKVYFSITKSSGTSRAVLACWQ